MRIKRLAILLIALTLSVIIQSGINKAQEETETLPARPLDAIAETNGFSIRYPDDWILEMTTPRSMTIASREDLPEDVMVAFPEDEILIEVGINNEDTILPTNVDIPADPSPIDILVEISRIAQPELTLSAPQAASINDRPAGSVTGTAGENIVMLIVWRLDSETYGTLAALTNAPDFSEYEATIFAMAASMILLDGDAVDIPAPAPDRPDVVIRDGPSTMPLEIAREFYFWYLAAYRVNGPVTERPIPFGLMTGAMLDQIQEAQAELPDPILCDPGLPTLVEIFATGQKDAQATAVAHLQFPGRPVPTDVQIDLEQRNDRWLVHATHCDLDPTTTAELVFSRYGYFIQREQRIGAEIERFADDWAFPWNRYMTTNLLEQQMRLNPAELSLDPFLCAQDVPSRFHAEAVAESDINATVILSGFYPSGPESFEEVPLLEAELLNTEDGWKMNVVTCIASEPAA